MSDEKKIDAGNDENSKSVPEEIIEEPVGNDALVVPPGKAVFGFFTSRKFKRGGFSVAITLIFIAAAILVNVLFNTLLSRFDFRADLTERRLHSIEPSTAEYLKNLDDTINFYFVGKEAEFTDHGLIWSQSYEIAERFRESNGRFTIRFVDRLADPAFSAKYGSDLSELDVVIESENTGRFRVVKSSDYIIQEFFVEGNRLSPSEARMMFNAGHGDIVQIEISAGAEQAFLSAILSVNNPNPSNVAITTGFGEGRAAQEGFFGIVNLLEKNSYPTQPLDLFTGDDIDPDTDFILMYAPGIDYSLEALAKIDKWLDNDGQLGKTLIYIADVETMPDLPNLEAFLAEWGIAAERGYVIQSNSMFARPGDPREHILTTTGSRFTNGITESSMIYGRFMRSFTFLFDNFQGITTSPFLITHPGAVLILPPTEEDEDEDDLVFGVYNVGVLSRKAIASRESNVVAFSSPYLFDVYLEMEQLSNARLLLNVFSELSGREETGVRITPKSFRMSTFEITAGAANIIALVFVVILPLLIIGTGLVVFFRRRYK